MILDMLFITLLIVYVVDLSGFIDSVKSGLSRWLGVRVVRIKPFDCSLCCTWWALLLYLLIVGRFTLGGIVLAAVFSLLALPLGSLIRACLELFNKLIEIANDKIDRL